MIKFFIIFLLCFTQNIMAVPVPVIVAPQHHIDKPKNQNTQKFSRCIFDRSYYNKI